MIALSSRVVRKDIFGQKVDPGIIGDCMTSMFQTNAPPPLDGLESGLTCIVTDVLNHVL
jgi:hypothetical protein